LTEAQLEQRRTAALRHGGEAAIKRLQHGEPFDGLALEAYQGVLEELGIDLDKLTGVDRVRVRRAARFEAVARLFDGAALAAAAAGDLERWERYQRRSGWIGDKGFRAFGEVRGLVTAGDGLIVDAIAAADAAMGVDDED